MRVIKGDAPASEILHEAYFNEHRGKKPFYLVRYLNHDCTAYIPESWMHQPLVARKAKPKDEVACFFSLKPDDWPVSRQYRSRANVLEVFEGRTDSNSDNESLDNASIMSNGSNAIGSVEDESDESLGSTEKYEEKIIMALESATEKSAQTRTNALQVIAETMSQRYLPDFVEDRKITFMDLAEKAIRRGKGTEQAVGAQIVPMLILQLGEGEEVVKALSPLLLQTMQNNSNSFEVRSKCCFSLALSNFLGCDDIGQIVLLMQQMQAIFSGSYLKGDKTPSSAGADAAVLHSAALSSWAILLTLIPPGDFVNMFNNGAFPSIENLMGLLESAHLEIRTTAGEVIALILESGRAHDEEFIEENVPDLIDATKQLATDSNKFRAKRDRKTQRATFRDVLRYIEDNISPDVSIRFGTESLTLDTWAIYAQYTALCSILGPGTNIHLADNDFLRDVLDLGEKVAQPTLGMKQQNRHQQKIVNAASSKARTVSRNRNRDKRSAVF